MYVQGVITKCNLRSICSLDVIVTFDHIVLLIQKINDCLTAGEDGKEDIMVSLLCYYLLLWINGWRGESICFSTVTFVCV